MKRSKYLKLIVLNTIISICLVDSITVRASEGIGVCIGLNEVDPKQYDGWSGPLKGCENDANDMAAIAASNGFKTTTFLTANATRQSILNAIHQAANQLTAGDIFMLSYSGHGGQVPDRNGDEDDGLDETWCLFDGELIDDELYQEWSKFKKGVRIVVFSDSCHSGSILQVKGDLEEAKNRKERPLLGIRAMPPEVAVRTYRAHKDFYDGLQKSLPGERQKSVVASVQSINACRDSQESMDGAQNGVFTDAVKQVWNDGHFAGDYDAFHKEIRATALSINSHQEAQHGWVEARDSAFAAQRPFTIGMISAANAK